MNELEQQLATAGERAEMAEKSAQRARAEADWLAQAAQEEPLLKAKIAELEQQVVRLETDSKRVGRLEANLQELEAENERLSRALKDQPGDDSPGEQFAGTLPQQPAASTTPETGQFGEGNFAVHLASYRSKENALDGWLGLRSRYPALLGDLSGHFAVFDVPSLGGRYFRLKAGPFDGAERAQSVCQGLTAAGQYCVVSVFDGETLSE